MAINIDSVYQTVLTIANVEQRGQITPQDFNYYANQAQNDLYNQNISDLAHFERSRKGTPEMIKLVRQRIEVFEKRADLTSTSENNVFDLPDDIYQLNEVFYENSDNEYVRIEQMDPKEAWRLTNAKIKPTLRYPKFIRLQNELEVHPTTIKDDVFAYYLKKPATPKWGYVGGDKPVYNSATSVDFELHPTQEATVVAAIVRLAGIALREGDLLNYGLQDFNEDKQIEKG